MINGNERPPPVPRFERPTAEVIKLTGALHAFFIREKLDPGAIMVLLLNTVAERLWLDRMDVAKVPAVLDKSREHIWQIYNAILIDQGGPRL